MEASFDMTVQQEISRSLSAGESLLWTGKPRQGLLLRSSDAMLIPFSLMWGGFAFFWEATVLTSKAPSFFALWGIPFVAMGIYLIIGRFFVDARIRENTIYGLTSQRVIIIAGLFTKTTTSLPLRTLSDISVQEKSDGSGSVLFGRPPPFSGWNAGAQWPGMRQYSPPGFELIPDARRVHDRVLEAQRAAA